MIRIVLADDHQSFIEGIESILKNYENEIKVVRTVNHGMGVIDTLKVHEVDIAILDISMPGMEKDGWIAAKSIREQFPEVKLLILTMHLDGKYIKELIDIGIQGYIVKNRSTREIVEAIKKIYGGGVHYSEGVGEVHIHEITKRKKVSLLHLTISEKDLLRFLFENPLSSKETADKLSKSKYTIDTHKKNIMRKLGVKSSTEMMKYVHDNLLEVLGLN